MPYENDDYHRRQSLFRASTSRGRDGLDDQPPDRGGRETDGVQVEVRPQEDFRLVTFGRVGRFSSYDVNKTSALLEIEDVERFGAPER